MKLPTPLHVFSEGLAFLLELATLAVLAWWGWGSAENLALRWVLTVAVPAVAAVVWGLQAAMRRPGF